MKNKKKLNKKSQMQMGETIGVLAVFFMIGLVAFVFYFKIAKSNIEQKAEDIKDLTSVAIVQRIMSLPELQCSDNNIIRENCVDLIKVQKFSGISQNNLAYFDLFGNSKIIIKKIYPVENPQLSNPQLSWDVYINDPNKAGKTTHPNKRQTNIPMAIYDPIADKNYFGIIEISTYSR